MSPHTYSYQDWGLGSLWGWDTHPVGTHPVGTHPATVKEGMDMGTGTTPTVITATGTCPHT